MRTFLLIAFFPAFAAPPANAAPPPITYEECQRIIKYQGQLPQHAAKALEQYSIHEDAIGGFERIRDNLLADTWWARSNGPAVTAAMYGLLEGTARAIVILEPTGATKKIAGLFDDFDKRIDEQLSSPNDPEKARVELVTEAIVNEAAKYGGRVGEVMRLIHSKYTAMKRVGKVDARSKELRQEVQALVKNLDDAISNYRSMIRSDNLQLQNVQGVWEHTQRFLDQNCRPFMIDGLGAPSYEERLTEGQQVSRVLGKGYRYVLVERSAGKDAPIVEIVFIDGDVASVKVAAAATWTGVAPGRFRIAANQGLTLAPGWVRPPEMVPSPPLRPTPAGPSAPSQPAHMNARTHYSSYPGPTVYIPVVSPGGGYSFTGCAGSVCQRF